MTNAGRTTESLVVSPHENARRRVCVFCGANDGADAAFRRAADELGRALAAAGHEVVYGGASVGLMGALADAALRGGAPVTGVIPSWLPDGKTHTSLTTTCVVATMHERKAEMASLADVFVVLPGGLGTLEEMFEALTWRQLGLRRTPLILLNVNGFYDPLLEFLEGARRQGMILPPVHEVLTVVDRVAGVMTALAAPASSDAMRGEAMTTVRLDHLRVDVADMDRSERFYRDVLGWDRVVRYETSGGVILQLGPDSTPPGVELWQEKGLVPCPSATEHLAFAVDDVLTMIRRVRALGYPVEREPWSIGEETVAFVRDPDGHLIEFNDFKGR